MAFQGFFTTTEISAFANHDKGNNLRETDVSDLSEAGAIRAPNGSDKSASLLIFVSFALSVIKIPLRVFVPLRVKKLLA
jgi:hypothetical protein